MKSELLQTVKKRGERGGVFQVENEAFLAPATIGAKAGRYSGSWSVRPKKPVRPLPPAASRFPFPASAGSAPWELRGPRHSRGLMILLRLPSRARGWWRRLMTSRPLTAWGGGGRCHGGELPGERLSLSPARPGHRQRARGRPGVCGQGGGLVGGMVVRLRGGCGGPETRLGDQG